MTKGNSVHGERTTKPDTLLQGLGFSAEYSSPYEIQGKDALLWDAALAIEVKGCNLPLGNPGETSGDPCYPSASSEAHWLLHGSSYV